MCEDDGDHYLGYNGLYCGSCNSQFNTNSTYGRSVYLDECSYNTVTCTNIAYKVAYKTKPSCWVGDNCYAYLPLLYGKYECRSCPDVNNYSDFGSGGSNAYNMSQNGWTWSSTSRCTANQNELATDAAGCKYKWQNVTPTSDCAGITEGSGAGTDVIYSTEELPNRTRMSDSNSCDYTGQKVYSDVPAGYGAKNNSTMNATCEPCTGNKWNDGTHTTCQNLPAHATVNSDNTGFICDVGYFASYGDTCVRCPMNVDMETAYSSWDYGTTSDAGATSVGACYYYNNNNMTDTSGTIYTGGACFFNDSSFSGYYILCLSIESSEQENNCYNALSAFAHNVLGIDYDHGQVDNWANDVINAAQPSRNTCEHNKQSGYYQGAGKMLDADDATWLKQFFADPTYAPASACNATVWLY